MSSQSSRTEEHGEEAERAKISAEAWPRFETSAEFYAWVLSVLKRTGALTEAEVGICEQLMLGRRYVDVAGIRSISEETVRWHAKKILKKLDAETTREFILVIGRAIDERADV